MHRNRSLSTAVRGRPLVLRARTLFQVLESRCLLSAAATDVVIQWSDIACDAVRNAPADHRGPTWISRSFGMVQGAVFDAINAIDGTYDGYLVQEGFPRWASMDAAGAQAAHDVLAALYPAQKLRFDAQLAATLAQVKDGKSEQAGIQAGQLAASRMLQSRLNDGAVVDAPYTASTDPGHWQPDPLNPSQAALGVYWGDVRPFVLQSANDIAVPQVPALTSSQYTAAYNEVKTLGGNGTTTPTTRTPEQTQIGYFWSYDVAPMGTPMVMYNQVLKTIALQQKNSRVENARLFGLANLAMADVAIVTWQVKWDEDFWRPITAIRGGNTDGNPNTQADPTWTPLGAPGDSFPGAPDSFTPPFPAYTSGHAGFGAATFDILSQFYHTDKMHFTLASDEFNPAFGGRTPVTRSFDSFSQASLENALSRIYLGVHWRFDSTVGMDLGNAVARRVFSSIMGVDHHQHRLEEAAPRLVPGFTSITVTLQDPIAQITPLAPRTPPQISAASALAIPVCSSTQSLRAAKATPASTSLEKSPLKPSTDPP